MTREQHFTFLFLSSPSYLLPVYIRTQVPTVNTIVFQTIPSAWQMDLITGVIMVLLRNYCWKCVYYADDFATWRENGGQGGGLNFIRQLWNGALWGGITRQKLICLSPLCAIFSNPMVVEISYKTRVKITSRTYWPGYSVYSGIPIQIPLLPVM
jgi:hypothetical protein